MAFSLHSRASWRVVVVDSSETFMACGIRRLKHNKKGVSKLVRSELKSNCTMLHAHGVLLVLMAACVRSFCFMVCSWYVSND